MDCDYDSGDNISITLTNTLVSGFTNAFAASQAGNGIVDINHTKTLFHNVTNHHATIEGSPSYTEITPVIGNPRLDMSYHLQFGSAAIDQGVETGLEHDLDGQPRPLGSAPDIGADESFFDAKKVFLPLIIR